MEAIKYDYSTGELSGQHVCRHCGALDSLSTVPEFVRAPAVWHGEARCVEAEEPVR